MSKWNIIKLAGKDFLIKSGIKKPLRFPIKHRGRSFAKVGKPRKKWGIKIYATAKTGVFRPRATNRFAYPKRVYQRQKMTGIEIRHLKDLTKKFGIERDLFDFKAHIDTSLSYAENKFALMKKIRDISPIKREFHISPSEMKTTRVDTGIFKKFSGLGSRFKEKSRGISLEEFKRVGVNYKDVQKGMKAGILFSPRPNRFKMI